MQNPVNCQTMLAVAQDPDTKKKCFVTMLIGSLVLVEQYQHRVISGLAVLAIDHQLHGHVLRVVTVELTREFFSSDFNQEHTATCDRAGRNQVVPVFDELGFVRVPMLTSRHDCW